MAASSQTTKETGVLGHGLASRLYLLAVFLMPLQLEVEQFKSVFDSRFPPGDVVLVCAVLAAPEMITFRRQAMSLLSLAFVAVLAYGVVLAIAYAGEVTNHAIIVKFFGGCVLVVWCVVTISQVRAGLLLTIMRTWLSGMAFWAVISYFDWRVADVVPFITHDLATRFGGAQFDQNNAGVAYGVAVILMWRYGSRVFSSRVARSALFAILATAFVLTLSRGAFLAVGGGVAVILAVDRVGATYWIRLFAVGCLALLIGLTSGLIDAAIDDFEARPDNITSRQSLIEDALDLYVDSNGLGVGLGTQRMQQGEIVHNTPILLLVETSLIGLSFFGALVALPIRAALRLRRFDNELGLGLLGGHVVMVIAALGIDALYQRHWWLLIGLCAFEVPVAGRPALQPLATAIRS